MRRCMHRPSTLKVEASIIALQRYFTNNAKLMSPVARLRPKVWLVSASRVVYSLVAMSVSLGTAIPSTKPSTEAATSQ